jgi:hypothetical protein
MNRRRYNRLLAASPTVAGETACPTIGNNGLALVAQAVSPAAFDFFTPSRRSVPGWVRNSGWGMVGSNVFVSGGDRNVYLITHEAASSPGTLEMKVKLGRLENKAAVQSGWAGYRVGIRLENDYRDSALKASA